MSGQILIQYEAVYNKTAELRNRIDIEIREMDTAYRQAQSGLRGMDGRTNAVLMETMECNQQKARTTADTLQKLLTFIEHSARQVERNEQAIYSVFSLSNLRTVRIGGGY